MTLLKTINDSKAMREQSLVKFAPFKVKVISNCTLNSLQILVENYGLHEGLDIELDFGTFDNPDFDFDSVPGDSVDAVWNVVLIDEIIDGLPYRVDEFTLDELVEVASSKLHGLKRFLSEKKDLPPILVSSIYTSNSWANSWATSKRMLQAHLEGLILEICGTNSILRHLDIQSGLENTGLTTSTSQGKLLTASAPLTTVGLESVAKDLVNSLKEIVRPTPKVLVLDADNTLWGGVIGELGVNGINLSPSGFPGNVYWRIQHGLRQIKNSGALLALVTKNEHQDIESYFLENENAVLKKEDFVSIKANWNDKVSNITELAQDLNLGLDSFVFLDDSDLETNLVSALLPEVRVLQVPKEVTSYFQVLSEVSNLFKISKTNSSTDRTELYKIRAESRELERKSATRESFLESLGTQIFIRINKEVDLERVIEMSHRTNQFNLNMARLTASELSKYNRQEGRVVLTGKMIDRFGSSGVAFASIATVAPLETKVEGLWISCRVLGRNAELSFIIALLEYLCTLGSKKIVLEFVKGERNSQVLELLTNLQGVLVLGNRFELDNEAIKTMETPSWIKVQLDEN